MQLIAYYRVSTERQGQSGLGLDAQRAAVMDYAKRQGGAIVAEYTEVESGKRADRPELARAIAQARRQRATLAVAKLDRLARNVAFLSAVMDSGIEFVACDNPHANRLTIHILAAVAEDEARRISERTRLALAALRERGAKLGSARPGAWTGREDRRREGQRKATARAAQLRSQRARAAVADLLPKMQALRQGGATYEGIARALNDEGQRTTRGGEWSAVGVRLALLRS